MDEFAHVMVIEFEMLQLEKVFDVAEIAGDQVVHPDDVVAFFDEPVAEMRP
jgi:hypothetical protein